MKTGDIGNNITFTVKDRDGSVVPTTDVATATLRWKVGSDVVAERAMTFVTPRSGGQVRYTTATGDLSTAGLYQLEVKIVFADGKTLHSTNVMREYVQNTLA